jgi:hypothetical protein
MRDFDQAVTALAVALGFSPKQTEAHAKLLSHFTPPKSAKPLSQLS